MENVYQEQIILHFQNPQNQGKPVSFNHSAKKVNPFCGDEIEVFLTIHNGRLEKINYLAKGCALSLASASILSETLKKKKIGEVLKLNSDKLLKIINIQPTATRIKCVLLPLEAIKSAVGKKR